MDELVGVLVECMIDIIYFPPPVIQVWARITTSRPVVDRIDSWTAKLRNVSVHTYSPNTKKTLLMKKVLTFIPHKRKVCDKPSTLH